MTAQLDPYATFADVHAAMSPGLPDHTEAMAAGIEHPPTPPVAPVHTGP